MAEPLRIAARVHDAAWARPEERIECRTSVDVWYRAIRATEADVNRRVADHVGIYIDDLVWRVRP